MVNLLMSQGHPEARYYPVPVLWLEAELARRRMNNEIASQAVLLKLAVGSILSDESAKEFSRQIKALTETD